MLSGIQVLRYISMDYQTQCDMNKIMHVSDIMQLQWTGDELQQVQHMIDVITQYVAECGEPWIEPVRREFLYRLMCMSKCSFIETHVAAYTRARPLNGKTAGKKYKFEYLFEGMQQYVQTLHMDRNEGRRVKALNQQMRTKKEDVTAAAAGGSNATAGNGNGNDGGQTGKKGKRQGQRR